MGQTFTRWFVVESEEGVGKEQEEATELSSFDEGDLYGVEFGPEASSNRDRCTKNSEHPYFISFKDFCLADLPRTYRDEIVLRFINLLGDLTAKLTVAEVSVRRPMDYAFASFRGKTVTFTGTAVLDRFSSINRFRNSKCPCKDCEVSREPHTQWCTLRLRTANHVVYDSMEAQKTTVEFFFDDETSRDGVCVLKGGCVTSCNPKQDWAVVEFVTHDLEFCDRLNKSRDELLKLEDEIVKKYKGKMSRMAVIVSHPHGGAKQISVGEWKTRTVKQSRSKNMEWSHYTYTTCTCKGSSGGPLFTLGYEGFHPWYFIYRRWNVFYGSHVHSDSLEIGLNKSCVGWEYHSCSQEDKADCNGGKDKTFLSKKQS